MHLGVDEKSFKKGHKYATIVNDLDGSRVLYVAKDREQASLDGFWKTLTPEQLAGIEGVAIDMWDAFENSIRAHVPDAGDKIVYDKFHIVKHLTEGVDKVRRQEHKQLRSEGDERLKGTKYDWLRHRENFDRADWREFQALKQTNLKTSRDWAIKEQALPHHVRGQRRLELQNPMGEAHRPRFPQLRQLYHRNLLPLRQTRP